MCGLNFTNTDNIDKMNKAIKHRGLPGRESSINVDGYAFGHVRLPIQGLSKKFDQPYYYKGHLFLFVGEIFNYKELMPKAKSDIEVLVHYWMEYGHGCFKFFDGFWSVIVYSINDNIIYVYTDQLCKKPLYIKSCPHQNGSDEISIASEIKALTCAFTFSPLFIDNMYFSTIGKWGYHIGNRTFDTRIKKIPTNTVTIIKNHKIHDQYKLENKINCAGLNLESTVRKAVKNRLISDVPVSLLLSGGIDSSIIYKLMVKHTKDFIIFHYDNGEYEYLEKLKIPSSIPIIMIKPTISSCEDALYVNETPTDLGSVHIQYQIAKAIQKHNIHVCISGDGADELFGGYKRSKNYDSQASDIWEELIYYHNPRLDKQMMYRTIELRTPFQSQYVLQKALGMHYNFRINKNGLKEAFKYVVPNTIADRVKYPLKSAEIMDDPLVIRYKNIKLFSERIIGKYYKGEN